MLRRSRFWVMLLVCWLGSNSCHRGARTPRAPSEAKGHLKVMSYNVNFGLGGDPGALAIIRENDCHVVFLQETTPGWERAIRRDLGDLYPHMAFRQGPGAGGLAVLSKYPAVESELIDPPPGGWFPAWRIVLETPLGRLQALNVHLRPKISDSGSVVSGYFTTDAIREREIGEYARKLDPGLPTLIVGDFNENRDGDAVEFLARAGMRSALGEFSPYQRTWRWNTSVGQISSELDHMVYDPRLEPLDVWVVERGRSDHLPVVGLFELAGER